MSSKCSLTVNGKTIRADVGDNLVDAALGGRIVLPHDCCVGHCETCRVTVLSGEVDDHGSRQRHTVLGCLATVKGDAEIAFDPVPITRKVRGSVETITELSKSVLEIRIRLTRPLTWLPGQYVRLTFKGYPSRDFSPTFAQDLAADEDSLVFQVRRYDNGVVSGAIGNRIAVGHPVTVQGPYGNAFLRRAEGRLILASSGTGWSPMWAVAVAARMGQPWREVIAICGVRQRDRFYMDEQLARLEAFGATVIRAASDGDGTIVRNGRPEAFLPQLQQGDTVYAAGSLNTVSAVRAAALNADVDFYADAFLAAAPTVSIGQRLMGLLGRNTQSVGVPANSM